MPRKPIELPSEVARAFVRDMRAFFAEKNSIFWISCSFDCSVI